MKPDLVMVNQVKELVIADLLCKVLLPGHLDDAVQMGLQLLLPSSLLLLCFCLQLPSSNQPVVFTCTTVHHMATLLNMDTISIQWP